MWPIRNACLLYHHKFGGFYWYTIMLKLDMLAYTVDPSLPSLILGPWHPYCDLDALHLQHCCWFHLWASSIVHVQSH